jgi:hypothetical protein
MSSGSFGIVGENGPELAYSGSRDLQIIPGTGTNKAPQVTNHFVMSAPGGQISRQSQSQAGAAVARSLAMASRRNNR